jgi:hypothetical protein
MSQQSIASVQIEAMLADLGKTEEDYSAKPNRDHLERHLLAAALEWVYDQTCATALAEFERAAAAYTGKQIDSEEGDSEEN